MRMIFCADPWNRRQPEAMYVAGLPEHTAIPALYQALLKAAR